MTKISLRFKSDIFQKSFIMQGNAEDFRAANFPAREACENFLSIPGKLLSATPIFKLSMGSYGINLGR